MDGQAAVAPSGAVIAGRVWPLDPWLEGWIAADVAAVSRGPSELWRRRQSTRLDELVDAAARQSAWWRDRLADARQAARTRPPWPSTTAAGAAAAIGPAWLQRVPPLRRRELMDDFDAAVTDRSVRLADARRFVQGMHGAARPFLDRYAVWESSGSTGEPALFVHDGISLAVSDAIQSVRGPAGALSWPGHWSMPGPFGTAGPWSADMRSPRIAFVGALDGAFAAVTWLQRLRQLNPWVAASTRAISFMQPMDMLVRALRDWRPSVLATYPSMAWVLAREQLRGALDLDLQAVWTGGEMLDVSLRRMLAQAFGCTIHDAYGASECLDIACECAQGSLHVNADWVILEPVDEQDRPVPPGEIGHTTLLTNLANRVLPIIRYDIGDRVCLSPEPCPCGSALPVITVDGRCDDRLTLAGSDGREVHLSPLAITTAIEEASGLFDFRVVQCGRRAVRLEVFGGSAETDATHGSTTRAEVAATALTAFLRDQGVRAPAVRLLRLAGPLDGTRSGKWRRVRAAAHAVGGRPPRRHAG